MNASFRPNTCKLNAIKAWRTDAEEPRTNPTVLNKGHITNREQHIIFIYYGCFRFYRSRSGLVSIKVVGGIRDYQAYDALRVWKDYPPYGD